MLKADILIIDPQQGFCSPVNPEGKRPALYVDGADEDMKRLATMLRRVGPRLNDIHVTMDTHHRMAVFHPLWWKDSSGKNPGPFTVITAKDVEGGVWTPTIPGLFKRSLAYVKALEAGGRYPLCVWPEHCLIGSWEHNIHPEVYRVLCDLEANPAFVVDYVTKGSNLYVEAYSVIKAEVPDPSDPTTQVNTGVIQALMAADVIGLAGEASSHCLFNSLKDIVTEFASPDQTRKIKLLTDCTSPVKGFEAQHKELLDFCAANGIECMKSTEFLS